MRVGAGGDCAQQVVDSTAYQVATREERAVKDGVNPGVIQKALPPQLGIKNLSP